MASIDAASRDAKRTIDRKDLIQKFAALAGLVLLVLLLHGSAILLALLFAAYLKRRLGGITGDTIGASIELAETLSYFVTLLVWKFLL